MNIAEDRNGLYEGQKNADLKKEYGTGILVSKYGLRIGKLRNSDNWIDYVYLSQQGEHAVRHQEDSKEIDCYVSNHNCHMWTIFYGKLSNGFCRLNGTVTLQNGTQI